MSTPFAITADDVRNAAGLLAGVAVRTPLLEYAPLNARVGGRVLVKFEGAQHTGSFKFRGAYNRLARIADDAKPAGVVAWSSGNHAQGVAAAARRLGMPAGIVMPADAPAIKLANTRALGAEIILYDRHSESREAIATELAMRRGAVLVPSFDDPFVIAGQGTAGLEILEQAGEAGVAIGRVLVCCGGGGLVAGIATAIKDSAPDVAVYCVEPAAFDDTTRSLASGRIERNAAVSGSICDAIVTPQPGNITFPILKRLAGAGIVVTDEEALRAMALAFSRLKIVVEPGGAVALAAALFHGDALESDTVIAVTSGGNVDSDIFAMALERFG